DSAGGILDTGLLLSPNSRPTIDLDANDSAASGNDYATSFIEAIAGDAGTGPVMIVDADMAIADANHANLQSATITLTNAANVGSESLVVNGGLPSGISVDGASTDTQIILTGDASIADYETALKQIQYTHTSQSPTAVNRFVTVTVNDGALTSPAATTTITVVERNDPPEPSDVSITVQEDDGEGAFTSVLITSATDLDGDAISVDQIHTTGLLGTATLVGGIVSYNPSGQFHSLSAGQTATTEFSFTLRDTRGALATTDGTVSLTIQGQNDAPTDIALTHNTVDPSDPVGTIIGFLAHDDPDQNDTWSWSLAAGDGDDDNGRFTIVDDGNNVLLKINAALPTQPTFTIRIRVADNHGASHEEAFTLIGNHRPILNLDADNSLGNSPDVSLTFTEGDAPLAPHDGLSITDVDGSNITTVDIVLVGATDAGESISFAGSLPAGLALDGLSTTTFLRVNGVGSLGDYEQLYQLVRYNHTSQNPTAGNRFVTFQASDAASFSSAVTATIAVVPVNDPPVLTTSLTDTLTFTNNSLPTAVLPDTTVTDDDHSVLAGATIQITSGYVNGEDLLQFTNQNGISGSFNAANGTLTLSGVASVADYQTALQSVVFNNHADPLAAGNRTVRFTATDGTDASTAVTRTLFLGNQAVLSLDGNNSAGNAPNFNTSFTEGGGLRILSDGMSLTDSAHTNLQGATITLTNPQDGSDEYVVVDDTLAAGFGITVSYGANGHSITLAGAATLDEYRQTLESVHYFNSSLQPNTTSRLVQFVVDNGEVASDPRTATIAVAAVNSAPTIRSGNFVETGGSGQLLTALDIASNLLLTDDHRALIVDRTFPVLATFPQDVEPTVPAFTGVAGATLYDFATGSASAASDTNTFYLAGRVRDKLFAIAYDGTLIQTLEDGVGGVDGLDGATATVVSPDLRHLYVAAFDDDSVTLFDRDPTTGELTFRTKFANGQNGISGLTDPQQLFSSPDGRHLIAYNAATAKWIVFARNAVTGALSFVGQFDSAGGASVLSAAFSPDGRHLYAGTADSVLNVYSRNPATGALAIEATYTEGVDGFAGLDEAESILVDPDGRHVYIASWPNSSLAALARDPATGLLSPGHLLDDDDFDVLTFANKAAISADGNLLYTAGFLNPRRLGVFEPFGMTRTFVENATALNVFGGNGAATIGDDGGTITSLTVSIQVVDTKGTSAIPGTPDGASELLAWSTSGGSITATPDANNHSVTFTGGSSLAEYEQVLRSITYRNTSDNPNTTPRAILAVVSDGSSTGSMFNRINITAIDDPPTLGGVEPAGLAYTENDPATIISSTITPADLDSTSLSAATIAIAANFQSGEDVLAFQGDAPSGITVGSFDTSTGVLQLTGTASIAAYQAALRSITYRNTSDAPSAAPRLVAFTVQSGAQVSNLVTREIAVTPTADDPVISFDAVQFVDELQNDDGPHLGLNSAWDVATTSDGKWLYVTARDSDDGLTVYRRDADTGELRFVTWYEQDAQAGFTTLDTLRAALISPDDRFL
ncbi:MAG: beta-propeller fold lactonase family protein, partial [Planctomycetales bacterium]|nr:beta-propeller fold lactonase family protein [Planctomycetales bacterium]